MFSSICVNLIQPANIFLLKLTIDEGILICVKSTQFSKALEPILVIEVEIIILDIFLVLFI